MSGDESMILEQAIDWHIAQSDMPEDRWIDYIAWLEADPAHAAAYDRVAADDRVIAEARFPVVAANDDAPMVGGRRWAGWTVGGSLAAALVAALIVPMAMLGGAGSIQDIATKAGERRTVTLPDGSVAELSGDTRLRLDRAKPRQLDLAQGETILHVRHDAANPFTITSGGVTVQDVGTVFNLARDSDRLSVAVAEGAVLVAPGREAVTLHRGEALIVHGDTHTMTRSSVDPDAVGGWRSGTLSFDGEPLDSVFAAVHRRDGSNVTLEGGLPHQPFTGIVRLTGAADRDVPHLATLIGATWRRDGERWILASGSASH